MHEVLAEVRRWIEQPAPAAEPPPLPATPLRRIAERTASPRPRRSPAATRGTPDATTELSIGTIEVTVEEAAAPVAALAPRPPAQPVPARAGREIVPSDYLRGW
jgi:hypothetical protein